MTLFRWRKGEHENWIKKINRFNRKIDKAAYIEATNKCIKQENIKNMEKKPEIWIANKKIDKNFKKSILNELNEKHGISKETIFVEIPHIADVSQYYLQLYEKAKEKVVWVKSQIKK